MSKVCCICLTLGSDFNKLTKKDSRKITSLAKLEKCIWEVLWLPSFYLCQNCTGTLDIVYMFRETCIASDLTRKSQEYNSLPLANKSEAGYKIGCNGRFLEDNSPLDNLLQGANDYFKYDSQISSQCDGDGSAEHDSPCTSSTDDENENFEVESNDADLKDQINAVKTTTISQSGTIVKRKRRRKFICEKCSKSFLSSTKLISHCEKDHGMEIKDVKPFSCDRCPQRFATSSNLSQHEKYHDGIKSNMCSYCGNGFITKTDLITHEKKHLNMREYQCEICNKSFNTHKDRRSHKLIVHTDSSNWKYVCQICSKPFPIKSNYDSHVRRHTGDKKFSCHLCEKKFTAKCDLQRHMRSHSDVREHQCPHCDKEYKDERVLKVHLAKTHGIGRVKTPVRTRNYVCHFCSKAYFEKNKLTRHLYTHSGEKPFSCPVCQKKFNDKSYVKQHLRNSHNVVHMDVLDETLIKQEFRGE
ncbi:zinc finger protein 2-like isoform X2 [Euwallacea fornicatus]|uniref:zinc finger protein 2-like isoform X2 n=1 Tax=Euwallacea fornicatus TaxID=995702 RepID=UPI00338F8D35